MDVTGAVHVPLQGGIFVDAFVTILVILDPLGNIPVFVALTSPLGEMERRRAAWQATVVATAVILVFAFFGRQVLDLLGISVQAIQVAGGLLLVLVALQLLSPLEDRGGPVPASAAPGRNPALVPLGTPLLGGPGAIAATMVYTGRAHGAGEVASVILALVAALVVVYLTLRFSVVVTRVLNENAIHLASRLIGFLLAAIAVQLVATGIQAWVHQGVH